MGMRVDSFKALETSIDYSRVIDENNTTFILLDSYLLKI